MGSITFKASKTHPTIFLEGKTIKKEKITKIINSTHLHKAITSCSNICKRYALEEKHKLFTIILIEEKSKKHKRKFFTLYN
jgi:hypothetical protein